MQDTSTEEIDQEISSLGLDVTYGWSGDAECLYEALEEVANKYPELKELWQHKKEEAKHLVDRFKGCKRKHGYKKPL